MNRRTFLGITIPVALAGVALAKEPKPDRLSGYVKTIEKKDMTINMHTKSNPSVERKIMYDDKTRFTVLGKPGSIDDVKDGMRIVGVGKFDGVNLKATDVSLTAK